MRRIHLSRHEKEVLRLVASGVGSCPAAYPLHRFTSAVNALEGYGLIDAIKEEGGGIVDAVLTMEGRLYIAENPSLRNPVDWKIVKNNRKVSQILF